MLISINTLTLTPFSRTPFSYVRCEANRENSSFALSLLFRWVASMTQLHVISKLAEVHWIQLPMFVAKTLNITVFTPKEHHSSLVIKQLTATV